MKKLRACGSQPLKYSRRGRCGCENSPSCFKFHRFYLKELGSRFFWLAHDIFILFVHEMSRQEVFARQTRTSLLCCKSKFGYERNSIDVDVERGREGGPTVPTRRQKPLPCSPFLSLSLSTFLSLSSHTSPSLASTQYYVSRWP